MPKFSSNTLLYAQGDITLIAGIHTNLRFGKAIFDEDGPNYAAGFSFRKGLLDNDRITPFVSIGIDYWNGVFATKGLPPNPGSLYACFKSHAFFTGLGAGIITKFNRFSIPVHYQYGWVRVFGKEQNPELYALLLALYDPREISNRTNTSAHHFSIGFVYDLQ